MGKNKAEPLECSRLPYRFPALMIILRELDPVATDVRPPKDCGRQKPRRKHPPLTWEAA